MLKHIFETHAHYDELCYAPDLDKVLAQQREKGVENIINCGFDLDSSRRSAALAARYPFIYAAVGVFPLSVQGLEPGWLEVLEALAAQPKVVAIGEIGLDYHEGRAQQAAQQAAFAQQIALAVRLGLPIQVHCRMAEADTMALLRTHRPQGLIHRFASDPASGKKFLDLGLYLGIGCNITYPAFAHVLDTVRAMPLDRLVLETDSPFLPPAWLAGQISTSAMIADVAVAIAAARGDVTPQQVLDRTAENAAALFLRGQKEA